MPIDVALDDRVRLVSSLLLLTHFIHENESWKPHELKTASLQYLEPYYDHPCAVAARAIAEKRWMSAFYCMAVFLKGPPGCLELGGETWEEPLDPGLVADFGGDFVPLLNQFYGDTALADFWCRTGSLWRECVEDTRALLQRNDPSDFIEIFFGPVYGGDGVHETQDKVHSELPLLRIIPEPLLPASFGFGLADKTACYAIVGPPTVPREDPHPVRFSAWGKQLSEIVFHELAHPLLSVAREKAGPLPPGLDAELCQMKCKGWFATMYDGADIRFDEIFIRAATALYIEDMERNEAGVYGTVSSVPPGTQETGGALAFLTREKEEHGIDLIDSFYAALKDYLDDRKQGRCSGLVECLPTLYERLDPRK